MLNPALRVRHKAAPLTAEVDGEILMLDVAAGLYFGLNPVASCVWRTIGTGASGADILEAVLAEFDVTPAEAEADIQQFVDELLARSLIETV